MKEPVSRNIQLVDGVFPRGEVLNVINDFLDIKIKFNQLQRLSKSEGIHHHDYTFNDRSTQELMAAQKGLLPLFNESKAPSKNITLKSTIVILVS